MQVVGHRNLANGQYGIYNIFSGITNSKQVIDGFFGRLAALERRFAGKGSQGIKLIVEACEAFPKLQCLLFGEARILARAVCAAMQ